MSTRDITFNTLEVTVEYDYTPAVPSDNDNPGDDSKVEISSIYIYLREAILPLTSFFEESGLIYKLEEQLKKELDKDND
jgi:hypothetical protein